MNTQKIFQTLEARYGSHSAAARALGYTPGHYRAIRNGRIKPSEKMMKLFELLTSNQSEVQNGRSETPN